MDNPCIKGMTVETCRYNPLLGCDCGAHPSIRCHKCGVTLTKHDFKCEHFGVYFHKDCFNPYEHYYGLDRPIN